MELTLSALEENHLANKFEVVQNGEEALDYLFRRGKFRMRIGGNPIVVLLDNKMPKVTGLERTAPLMHGKKSRKRISLDPSRL